MAGWSDPDDAQREDLARMRADLLEGLKEDLRALKRVSARERWGLRLTWFCLGAAISLAAHFLLVHTPVHPRACDGGHRFIPAPAGNTIAAHYLLVHRP